MNENQNPNHLNDEDPFGLNSTFDTFFGDILEERADGDHIPPSVANEAAKMTTEYVVVMSQDGDTGEYFEEKVTRQEYDRLVAAGVYKPADEGNDDDDPGLRDAMRACWPREEGEDEDDELLQKLVGRLTEDNEDDPTDDPNGEYDREFDPADEALDALIDEVAALEQAEFEREQAAVEAERDADEARRSELRPLSAFSALAKPDTLRRAAIEGRLRAEKLGRNWFATEDDVLRYLKRATRPPVTLRGLLDEVTREASAWRWSAGVFKGALALAHAKISALGTGASSPVPQNDVRFVLHQVLNRLAHEARAAAIGVPLVTWFFNRDSYAEEYSLFGSSSTFETIPDAFVPSVRGTIIGYGCKDMAVDYGQVRAQLLFYSGSERYEFDPAQSYDWGWRDDLGDHIEYYDAESRTFVRKSMSGRHDYAIRLDADGRVLSVEAGPQLLMRRANIEALLDIDLTRPVRWSEIVRPVFSW